MRKISKLLAGAVFALALVGCPTNSDTPSNGGGSSNGGSGCKIKAISGLNANKLLNGYIGDVQYSIILNAEAATFKATPTLGRGDSDAKILTGTFVCDKVTDDLFWYGKNTNVCLKVDGTDKCCKIAADLTNPDSDATSSTAKGVTVNKYHTSDMTKTEFTATQKAVESKPADKPVTLTEEQKNCFNTANIVLSEVTEIKTCSTKQTFTTDSANKDMTVGVTLSVDDITCDIYINKDTKKIEKYCSSSTPSWFKDTMETVLDLSSDPTRYLTDASQTKVCDLLNKISTAVEGANDEVIYTKDEYIVPDPWSSEERSKISSLGNKMVSSYETPQDGQIGILLNDALKGIFDYNRFSNDDAFHTDANDQRDISELVFVYAYGEVDGSRVDGNTFYYKQDEKGNDIAHKFGFKVKIDLEKANDEIKKHNLEGIDDSYKFYDIFTIESVSAIDGQYEATPSWFLDAISTVLNPSHTDYDRMYDRKLVDICTWWIEPIYYEYVFGPGFNNGALNPQYEVNVYEYDETNDDFSSIPTTMLTSEIKKMIKSTDYKFYFTPTDTNISYYDISSKENPTDSQLIDGQGPTYNPRYSFPKNLYAKKNLLGFYYINWAGSAGDEHLVQNSSPDKKVTLSEVKEEMENYKAFGCKVFLRQTTNSSNRNEYYHQWTGVNDGYNMEVIDKNGSTTWTTSPFIYFQKFDIQYYNSNP